MQYTPANVIFELKPVIAPAIILSFTSVTSYFPAIIRYNITIGEVKSINENNIKIPKKGITANKPNMAPKIKLYIIRFFITNIFIKFILSFNTIKYNLY